MINEIKCQSALESCYVREPFTVKLSFRTTASAENIFAHLWTQMPDGAIQETPMDRLFQTDTMYTYVATIAPAQIGVMEYRGVIKVAEQFYETEYHTLSVMPPREEQWQHQPVFRQVDKHLWVGNARASFEFEQHGFDCVLNVADQFHFSFSSEACKNIPLLDWGTNAIPREKIQQAVDWLDRQVGVGKRVILNCRAGIGRSGSIAVSYIYAKNPQLNYHQAVHRVRHGDNASVSGKMDIYPHVGLKESLEELYPGHRRPRSTTITKVELRDYRLGQRISVPRNSKLNIRGSVDYEGELEPFVFIHSNLNGGVVEDTRMTRGRSGCYEAELVPKHPGAYWLTTRASNYMVATPWYEPEVWPGGMGENLYIEVT